jgi:hypothetical protein
MPSKNAIQLRKRRAHRIANGLCVECKEKAAPNKRKCEHHLLLGRNWLRKHNKKKTDIGICIDCNKPKMKDNIRCLEHNLYNNENNRRDYKKNRHKRLAAKKIYRDYLRENNRCICCYLPLDEEVDENYITCFNCRTKAFSRAPH